jgi:hypothetical protein
MTDRYLPVLSVGVGSHVAPMWPRVGPVPGRGRLRRSGPPRPGTGSAGRARQGRCKARPTDLLLAKPDRAGSSPATAGEQRRPRLSEVVRGCPRETGKDRCKWHASGTAGSTRMASGCRRRLQMSRRRGPPWMTDCLVGKPRRRRGRRVRTCVALAAGCGRRGRVGHRYGSPLIAVFVLLSVLTTFARKTAAALVLLGSERFEH